jgi:fused signal recognition particle receptor
MLITPQITIMFFNLFKKSDKPDVKPDARPDDSKVTETAVPELPAVEPAVTGLPTGQAIGDAQPESITDTPVVDAPVAAIAPEVPAKPGFFARIKQGLSRTSSHFAEGLGNLFLGRKTIDDELFEELETQLLVADVGMDATTEIIDSLTARVARKQLNDVDALYAALREHLTELLRPVEQPLVIDATHNPYVILVVGVNGVGKTTTIGKLAKRLQSQGKKVMLAAGDTFRAAAVEQLQVWGDRNNVPVIAQHTGADSASVIYDALQAAKARGIDVIIADTAGRLHNKNHLMDELSKVKRVMAKVDGSAPHEVLLVLDAGTGQNAVNQTETFRDAAGVTGLVLTKLDGTAKGGVIFALSKKFGLPVRFIGVGEAIDDLQPFAAEPFIKALFNQTDAV